MMYFLIGAALLLAHERHHTPRPDAVPGGAPATIIPLCAPLKGVPRGWWVAEGTASGYILCVGPNR
jgi:hypothetical protein